jgi:putative DNA primase/helicase
MYNMMTHREEIISNKFSHQEVIGLAEEQRIYRLEDIVKRYNFPTKSVKKYLKLGAMPYHPVLDWINSKEWDQKDRFEELFTALDVLNKNQELAKTYLWKWCLAGCRAILTQQGFISENVLILKGDQGAGKTKFLSKLAPPGCVKTGIQLNPSNKDSVLEATSVWIAELGELDGTTSKSDTASLKAFFSKNIDYIRKPYGVTEELIPRKTIFCGSVNSDTFLVDDTGNRRYWVLEIGEANHKHEINMQQYWRQVMETAILDKEEHPHWLTKEEAKAQNLESRKFKDMNPLCQKILKIENQLIDEKYSTQEIASLIEHDNLKPHESKVIKQFMISDLGWSLEPRGGRQYWLINPNVYVPSEGSEDIF